MIKGQIACSRAPAFVWPDTLSNTILLHDYPEIWVHKKLIGAFDCREKK
jgi:hypothetical protein